MATANDRRPAGGDDRRAFLRKGLVGAGIAASAPIVSTFATPAGAAASDPAPAGTCVIEQGSNKRRVTGGAGAAIPGALVNVYSTSNCSGGAIASATATANGSYDTGKVTFAATTVYLNQDDGTGAGQCSGPVSCT